MKKPYPIKKLEQFKALTSPIRGEIIDLITLMGELSISELAEYTGRPIDSLYYHIKRLTKVGLLIETGKRKSNRQMEAIFDIPGRPMYLQYEPSQKKHVENVIKSISVMLRATDKNFKKAFQKNLIRVSNGKRNFEHSLSIGWYTEKEIIDIRKQIRTIITKFHKSTTNRKTSSELFALTIILTPLENKKRNRNE